jgi:hypothetical protein
MIDLQYDENERATTRALLRVARAALKIVNPGEDVLAACSRARAARHSRKTAVPRQPGTVGQRPLPGKLRRQS